MGRSPSMLMFLLLATASAAAWADNQQSQQLVDAAQAQVGVTIHYDGRYQRLDYPGGDVPIDRGVCTDVLVRAFREVGIDLQQRVHEDMKAHFDAYPGHWGLTRPDRNIDHRRVPNLETWFKRSGMALLATTKASDYAAGDVVSWRLPGGLPHIGIVSSRRSADDQRPMIVHNIGAGAQVEDVLFAWTPVGHFRPFPVGKADSSDATPKP